MGRGCRSDIHQNQSIPDYQPRQIVPRWSGVILSLLPSNSWHLVLQLCSWKEQNTSTAWPGAGQTQGWWCQLSNLSFIFPNIKDQGIYSSPTIVPNSPQVQSRLGVALTLNNFPKSQPKLENVFPVPVQPGQAQNRHRELVLPTV